MKPTLLLIGPLLPSIQRILETTYEVHRYWEADDASTLLQSVSESCVGVVTDGGLGVSNEVLRQLPRAGLVAVFGVGVDAVDLQYCQTNGIKVSNTPDVLSDDVADMAVALALAVSRQLVTGDQYARSGRWAAEGAMPLSTRMMGKKAGIYGMGSIGSALARRLEGFNMDIHYCNRSPKAGVNYTFVSSLIELATAVDFLFITAAATPATLGAVNEAVINALGTSGYLINVSRGSLIDEAALLHALQQAQIAGAGLDVFANEPTIPKPFFDLNNVVLQPHNASGTWETREAMGQLVLDNLAAHLSNKPLLTAVV